MDKLELKRRVRAGIKSRISDGRMADPSLALARPDPRGANFSKAQRKLFQQLVDVAIYDLAHDHFRDWYDALIDIADLMAAANFQKTVVISTFKAIEHVAVDCTGDKTLYLRAAKAMQKFRSTVISIPGQRPGKTQAANDEHSILDDYDKQTARGSDERPAGNGETR